MSFVGDFPLKGKIASITGAGSGISLSFAKSAVKQGAREIVADLKLIEDGEKYINEEEIRAAIFTKCDVAKPPDLENLITDPRKSLATSHMYT
jgi:NAD(P)-dependent dehydrogenase (short-subunit alcohol dehydrogenase family)